MKDGSPEARITLEMSDADLREAVAEWVMRHTVFKVETYEGVKGGTNCGTYDFPAFKLGVTVRAKRGR